MIIRKHLVVKMQKMYSNQDTNVSIATSTDIYPVRAQNVTNLQKKFNKCKRLGHEKTNCKKDIQKNMHSSTRTLKDNKSCYINGVYRLSYKW